MSRNFKDIAAEALALPLAARAELASELLDSLDYLSEEENEQLWAAEAERRFTEYKAGRVESAPCPSEILSLAVASLTDIPPSDRLQLTRKLGQRKR